MKVVCVYVYPLNGEHGYDEKAYRFIESYNLAPPGMDHETVIMCNGGPTDTRTELFFAGLPNCRLMYHDNSGLDIGAFQAAARAISCDLMVFFGSSTYFKRAGWMNRIVGSYQSHGDAIYGCTANSGQLSVGVHPHIRTTAFWMSPLLFSNYPVKVIHQNQRYPFEHGPGCLTSWVRTQGKQAWVVAWQGDYAMGQWETIPNGLHRGDQSNVIIGDRLTCPPYYHTP